MPDRHVASIKASMQSLEVDEARPRKMQDHSKATCCTNGSESPWSSRLRLQQNDNNPSSIRNGNIVRHLVLPTAFPARPNAVTQNEPVIHPQWRPHHSDAAAE